MMKSKAAQKSYDHVGSRTFNLETGREDYRPSVIPAGLSRSRKDQVQFDSMKDLKKFLKNCCCIPGSGATPCPSTF